jgi:hypothetical protein
MDQREVFLAGDLLDSSMDAGEAEAEGNMNGHRMTKEGL